MPPKRVPTRRLVPPAPCSQARRLVPPAPCYPHPPIGFSTPPKIVSVQVSPPEPEDLQEPAAPGSVQVSPPEPEDPQDPAIESVCVDQLLRSSLPPNFETDIGAALECLWRKAGAHIQGGMRIMPELAELLLDSELKIVSECAASDDIITRVNTALHQTPRVCASCGVATLSDEIEMSVDDPILDLFILRDEPLPGCVVNGNEVRQEKGMQYVLLLYPEGYCRETQTVIICRQCHGFISRPQPVPPKYSMLNGICFGRTSDLPKLSFLEEMCLARVRLFTTVVQLVPQHGTQLKGTCISFDHLAPDQIAIQLPPTRDTVLDAIKVMFVGSAEEWAKKKTDILSKYYPCLYQMFEVDRQAMTVWLQFLKQNNDFYRDVHLAPERFDDLVRAVDVLFGETYVAETEGISNLQKQAVSDIAGARPTTSQENFSLQMDSVMITSKSLSNVPSDKVLQALHGLCVDPSQLPRDKDDTTPTLESELLPTYKVQQPRIEPTVIPRLKKPINEFTDGERFYATAFPHLFLLGKGPFEKYGTLTVEDVRYLLRFHDGRFGKSPNFLYYCHNMLQRHAALRQVTSFSLKGTDAERKEFLIRANSDEFKKALQDAVLHPESAHAKKLLREILPYLRAGSTGVPNGPRHHETVLSEMRALAGYLGLPALFVTVALMDFNQVAVMQLQMLSDGLHHTSLSIPFVTKDERITIANNNPAFCAEVFHKVLRIVMEELCGTFLTHKTKVLNKRKPNKDGIFGTMRGHYTITEPQGRGTLHWHQLLWVNASPEVLEAALRNPLLFEKVSRLIDAFICTGVPKEYLREVFIPGRNGLRHCFEPKEDPDSDPWHESTPCPLPSCSAFSHRVNKVAAKFNSHDPRHRPTCSVGPAGRVGCRMAVPKPTWDKTGPVSLSLTADGDVKYEEVNQPSEKPLPFLPGRDTVVWEQQRKTWNAYISPFNPTLTAVCCCNTNVQYTGPPSQARGAMYYQANYMAKDPHKISSALACMLEAIEHVDRYESVAKDRGSIRRDFCWTIQRLVNNMTSRHEVSSQQAASTCLGYTSSFSSEAFWFTFPRSSEDFLNSQGFVTTETIPRLGSLTSTIMPQEDGGYTSMSDDSDGDSIDSDSNTSDEFCINSTRTFEVLTRSGTKIASCGEHVNMFFSRPDVRNNVSLYEAAAVFDVVSMPDEIYTIGF